MISTPDFKNTPMISIKGLAKKYDSLLAVDEIDLEISKGESFCFLGPNGAGKTTTIKLLVALLKPTSGSIFIDGIDLGRNSVEVNKYRLYSLPPFSLWQTHRLGVSGISRRAFLHGYGCSSISRKKDSGFFRFE